MIELIFAFCTAVDGDTLKCPVDPRQRPVIARMAPKSVMRRWRGRVPARIRIRLKAINTPERCQAGYSEARTALAAMIRHKPVTCRYERAWTWQRPVMTCFVAGRDIGRRMVDTGHAKACRQHGGQRYDPDAKRCKFVKCGRRR